jgi:streptothricin acetyltransferase
VAALAPEIVMRDLTLEDVPRLKEIDPRFVSDAILHVDKTEIGLGATWSLTEMPLAQPFDKGHGYDLSSEDLARIRNWLERGEGLHLVAEMHSQLVAQIDIVSEIWNRTAWVWNVAVDWDYRGRGIGRTLIERAMTWARSQSFRALSLETQSNNINACRFYHHMGFRLTGIRDNLYSNGDIEKGEVAIFWSYAL